MLGLRFVRAVSSFSASRRLTSAALDFAEGAPIPRDTRFATLTDADIVFFRRVLASDNALLIGMANVGGMNVDYMKRFRGESSLALRPTTTQQLAQVLRYCNERRLAVVPQGGNTGLVGGSVPVHDEVILSTTLMNKIESFDPVSGVLVCQAGCILQHIIDFAQERGHLVPLDLGAKGSCQIGGNIATNAGGLRFMKFGSLRQNVVGLEVVLANGDILDCMKNQSTKSHGIDWKQLFIGSEGTLGIISRVAIQLKPSPKSIAVAFLACSKWENVMKTMSEAQKRLGEVVHAIEYLDRPSMDMVLNQLQYVRDPLSGKHPYYVLIEVGGSNPHHDEEKIFEFIDFASSNQLIADGTMATEPRQVSSLWRLREGIPPALRRAGPVYKYDLSIDIQMMPSLVEDTQNFVLSLQDTHNLPHKLVVMGFGHLVDGNIHLNISAPADFPTFYGDINNFVYGWTVDKRGSTSAEHGIGRMKVNHIPKLRSDVYVSLMKAFKNSFDPHRILNPYKMVPES